MSTALRADGREGRPARGATLGAEDGLTKVAAISASRHKYIVMESEKFYYNECYKFAHFDDVDGFISDKLPNAEMQKELEAAGVELY